MRQVKGNEKQGRNILNGRKVMSSVRIDRINSERRESLSAEEAQGRAELERKNASISMFSED
jgi:hypothetical protein